MVKYNFKYMKKESKQLLKSYLSNVYKRTRKLEVDIVDNGILLPAKGNILKGECLGGVINQNGTFLKSSSCERIGLDGKNETLFGGYYKFHDSNVKTSDETVVYLGIYWEHWGHFLCDIISRLWFIIDSPSKYKIVYLSTSHHIKLNKQYLEFFELIGIKKEQLINITRPTRFKRILVPEVSYFVNNYYTNEYKKIFDKVCENVNLSLKIYEKIYFTRRGLLTVSSKEYGEEKIEELFAKNGFQVLSPEKLSLKEQIHYIRNCKTMVSLSGTIPHNVVFAKPGLELLIINKFKGMNIHQPVLNRISLVKNVTYIDANTTIFPVLGGNGPFILNVNKHMKHFLTNNNMTYDNKNISEWINEKVYILLWYVNKYVLFNFIDNVNRRRLFKMLINDNIKLSKYCGFFKGNKKH